MNVALALNSKTGCYHFVGTDETTNEILFDFGSLSSGNYTNNSPYLTLLEISL